MPADPRLSDVPSLRVDGTSLASPTACQLQVSHGTISPLAIFNFHKLICGLGYWISSPPQSAGCLRRRYLRRRGRRLEPVLPYRHVQESLRAEALLSYPLALSEHNKHNTDLLNLMHVNSVARDDNRRGFEPMSAIVSPFFSLSPSFVNRLEKFGPGKDLLFLCVRPQCLVQHSAG